MHKRRHGPASSGPCGASGRQAAAQQGVANHIPEAIQLHATSAWGGFLASCEHDRRPGERSPIAYPVELRGPDARVPGPRKAPQLARGDEVLLMIMREFQSRAKDPRWHEVLHYSLQGGEATLDDAIASPRNPPARATR